MATENAYRIHTEPPQWEGYKLSGAFRIGNLVFTSGRAAIDSEGNVHTPDGPGIGVDLDWAYIRKHQTDNVVYD